ncbi:MAG: NYN domain-containing protein [Papillibacter sp.]|nr:NYN domain-containing protein [Papillibacter sp.]
MANEIKDLRLAVLIDADNVPRNSLKAIMEEAAIYGTPTIKRIYGDWTSPNIGGWKTELLENAVTPIQQYGYTTGKNSTDSAMIIDAMDILYGGKVDGFCIVSSDSDFTRLATRLREAGMKVIGMGEKKTPSPFIVACDKFIYIEVIRAAQEQELRKPADKRQNGRQSKQQEKKVQTQQKQKQEPVLAPEPLPQPEPVQPEAESIVSGKVPEAVIKLIADSVSDIADEDGYAFMGELGNLLLKKQPDFDPRNFGFKKLTTLIRSIGRFDIDVRQTGDSNIKHIYLRDKES